MPEKQERLHQFNPTESVVMTSGQQAQKMVEEAKKWCGIKKVDSLFSRIS